MCSPAVLARDRLVAGGEVDDAQPRMAQADRAIGRDPDALPIGAAMVQGLGGALQPVPGNRAAAGEHRDNTAHAGSILVEAKQG